MSDLRYSCHYCALFRVYLL